MRLSPHSIVAVAALGMAALLPMVTIPVGALSAALAPRQSLLRTLSLCAVGLSTVFLVAYKVPALSFLIVP